MEESGLSAVVEYVFHQKQQLGCLRVRDGVIVLEAMYFADEIRPVKGIAPKRSSKVDKKELEMAQTLGEEVHAPTPEKEKAPTDLVEALRASVDAAKGQRNGR